MHSQVFWFKHGFFGMDAKKRAVFCKPWNYIKKAAHPGFYCSLKKAWAGLILVSSGDGSCSD